MRHSRGRFLWIAHILDDYLPPALRDSRWFMAPIMHLLFREFTDEFMTFKERAFALTEEEFSGVYQRFAETRALHGDTDLNRLCTQAIREAIRGSSVLEVGAGRGYFARMLAQDYAVTATDITSVNQYPGLTFRQANIEELPFKDSSFDTVICAHTLEHVQHLERAIAELRRVAKQRLIVVVPRQRPYRYTFNLHVHFFPYPWSIQAAFGYRAGAHLENLGDWFYFEDRETVRRV
jgi:ubiquinone/menaquinone biosynthesis C-methylase UbiE